MAEKRFLKGLFKDTGHLDQPENTWRYALNAVINRLKGTVSNEKGTIKAGELNASYRVIGAIEISDDRVVLFSKQTLVSTTSEHSEIGIWEKDTYTRLFRSHDGLSGAFPRLSFSTQYPIEGTYKINVNNDLVVYFTDDLNPPRAFNITRQQRALAEDPSNESILTTWLYGINFNDSHSHHIELLNLFPSSGPIPTIKLSESSAVPAISEGGGLKTGVYYLALAYVDEDLVATNFLSVSNPVSIIEEFDSTRPTTKIDGSKAGVQTSKSIKWDVANTGKMDYKYIRPVVVRKMGEAVDAFKLNDIEIDNIIENGVTFNGTENVSAAPVESVIVDTVGYDTAKNITQLDDILYLGNTTSNKDIGYQKYANNIKLAAITKKIPEFDTFIASVDNFETGWGTKPVDSYGTSSIVQEIDDTKSYRSDKLNHLHKGYMRDEVYAFYIAFILHDGSMSNAYHIPGREAVYGETTKLSSLSSSNPFSNLKDLSPYAQLFHVQDSSTADLDPENRYMNYWQNTNEVYPTNPNYEIWDETGKIGDLSNTKVRHHHFPGNCNPRMSSVTQVEYDNDDHATQDPSFFEVAESAGTEIIGVDYTGTYKFYRGSGENINNPRLPGNSADGGEALTGGQFSYPCTLNAADASGGSTLSDADAYSAFCPSESAITIPAAMTITGLKFRTNIIRTDGNSNMADSSGHIVVIWHNNEPYYVEGIKDTDTFGPWWQQGDGPEAYTSGTLAEMYEEVNISSLQGEGTGVPISLVAGDRLELRARGYWGEDKNDRYEVRFANSNEISWSTSATSYIEITVETSSIEATEYDLKVKHEVQPLGFNLYDIKIPKSLKDKVQGFRVYRAKRTHENKTVLGQAPILPMSKKANVIGMCKEANGAPEAQQILGTLQQNPEIFYNKDPWPLASNDSGYETNYYRNFAFPDFHLLRTKNSLAPATHITPQYQVGNFVWNGPTTNQDKKMVTRLHNFDSVTDPIEIREHWGYDDSFNCYPSLINSAIFIGGIHVNTQENYITGAPFATGMFPKLLGQKAKTYLLGDSIFSGTALGFGGKVFNEFGETTAIFGLKDGHLLKALDNKPDADPSGISALDYGSAHSNMPALLVNGEYATAESGTTDRSNIYIANLDAFKTDVYKSIDAQTLIFTGYEIIGDDLDRFVFEDDEKNPSFGLNISGTGPGMGFNYNTQSKYPEGIFGGDTFICRYGFVSTLTPSNPEDLANPKKAIHYHIVETPDNISLRHSEDDDSLYFPGAAAKQILQATGKDFSHVDNLKYNDNYSAGNDIRSAFPLPIRNINQTDFSTRAHRSTKADAGSFIDNYRIFLASQFKDLPRNRGELWKLASFNNLLYFHMENSLFAAKGKQSMQLGDGSEAFVGSGDIFQQEPDEIIQTELGYGGTQSQWAAITTRYGYFFVDTRSKKVFMMSDKLIEISLLGMEDWFRRNLRFTLEEYGFIPTDNPIYCAGLHSIWDPRHKKIVLSLRDVVPTQKFIEGFNIGLINQNYEGAIYYDETLNIFLENLNGTEAPDSEMYTQMITYGGTPNPQTGIPLWNLDIITQQIDYIGAPGGPNSPLTILEFGNGASEPPTQPFFTTSQYLNYTSTDTIFYFTGDYASAWINPTVFAAAGASNAYEYLPIWVEQQVAAGNIEIETNIDIAILSSQAVPNSFDGEVGDLVDEGIVVHIDEVEGKAYVVPTSSIAYGDHTSPSPSVEFGCYGVNLNHEDANIGIQGFDVWSWGGGVGNTAILIDNCNVGLNNSGVPHAGVFSTSQSNIEGTPAANAASFPTTTAAQLANNYSISVEGVIYNDWYLPNRKELTVALEALQVYHEAGNTSPFPQPTFGHQGAQTYQGLNLGRFWTSVPDDIMGGDTDYVTHAVNLGFSANMQDFGNVGWGANFWFNRLISLGVLPMRIRPYNQEVEELTLDTKVVDCDDPEYFTRKGWTVSYYPEINAWGSFHSYVPYLYFNTATDFYSLTDRTRYIETDDSDAGVVEYELGSAFVDNIIWKHSFGNYGNFYDAGIQELTIGHTNFNLDFTTLDNFEFEFIYNDTKTVDSLYSSISYVSDVRQGNQKNIVHNGFSSAFIYNSFQMSEELKFSYLSNIRKIGNAWKFNQFRDMSKLRTDTSSYFMGENENVVGELNVGTVVPNEELMFNIEGMYENQNQNYLNLEKLWNLQKKFVDKWLGIRLICSNSHNYSVNLYTSSAEKRKFYR